MNVTIKGFALFFLVTVIVLSGSSGITHTTTGDGTKVTDTVWSAEHTYTPATATNAHRLIWKSEAQQALHVVGAVASTADWTDLDLTAYTSSSAKIVYLQMAITVTTAAVDYYIEVRKNGTTSLYPPIMRVESDEAHAGDIFTSEVIVGIDTDEVVEYYYSVGAGGQASFDINVLAYWE